ncbi:MAG: hypothetical protein ABF290_10610 [Thiogranum sp.]
MKELGLTIALLVLAMSYAQADSYETYAFGDTASEACEKAKSDLNDQAILQCRMNGGSLAKADVRDCRMTKPSSARYKVLRAVEFVCKPD